MKSESHSDRLPVIMVIILKVMVMKMIVNQLYDNNKYVPSYLE
jgi:hypothetical protein